MYLNELHIRRFMEITAMAYLMLITLRFCFIFYFIFNFYFIFDAGVAGHVRERSDECGLRKLAGIADGTCNGHGTVGKEGLIAPMSGLTSIF